MIIHKSIKTLKNFFTEFNLEKIARETNFIKRKRKITAISFFESVFFGFSKNDNCSLDFLRSIFSEKNITLSKSSLHEKMNNSKAVNFMREILEKLCAGFVPTMIDYVGKSCKFTGIKVLDSTEIKLNNKLKMFKNKQNGSRCKLQTFLELHSNAVNYKMTKGNENDQGYKEYLDDVEKDNLIIVDLGYFCLGSFKKISSKGAKFISRFKRDVTVMNLDGKKIAINSLLKNSNNEIDTTVLIGKKEKMECRLVAKKLTGKALKNREAKLKRDAKRRQRRFSKNKKPLEELDLWSIYITNLQEESIDKIHTLYVLRWQIEIFFKLLKSKLSLSYVKYTSEYMAMIAIYAKLIAITIMMILTRSISDVEISLFKAIDYFKDMIKELYSAITNCTLKRCEEFLLKVKRFAKKEQSKKRPSSFANAGFGKSKSSFLIFGYSLNKLKLNC